MNIIWNKELETGIEIIDEQHKFIIDSLSGVKTLKLANEERYQSLKKLQAYLATHFESEEYYMQKTNYFEFKKHKFTHDKVLADCKKILAQNSTKYSQSDIALDLINYLENWFVDHYTHEDVKLAKFLKQNVWQIEQSDGRMIINQ